jgi:hypothetical protein
MTSATPDLVPDTKDWTWVLSRACAECGTDTHYLPAEEIGPRLLASADALVAALQRPDAAVRPRPDVWSPLEYGCHVRDVCRVFAGRLHRMLTEDGPAYDNGDPHATAGADGYAGQDPAVVARQLLAEARSRGVRRGAGGGLGPARVPQRRRRLHRAHARALPRPRPGAPRARRPADLAQKRAPR